MWKIASAAVFAACFVMSGATQAADLSLKDTPVVEYGVFPIWTGLYVGGHLGVARGNIDVTDVFDYNGDPRADNSFDTLGAIAGVQIGHNVQRGNFVFGVEADLGYLDLSGDDTFALPRSNPTDKNTDISAKYSTSGGLYGDLTGRVGYASGNTLLYLKGGAAFLNATFNSDYAGANCSTTGDNKCKQEVGTSNFAFENSDTLFGYTIGAGVEYALSPSWSLKLEYQRFDFGSMSSEYGGTHTFKCQYNSGSCTSKLTGESEASLTVDAVKVGLNYQFNRPEDPIK
jgi:outer membrane immunogenic protein